MTVTAGIDVGSTYTKVVIQASDGTTLARAAAPTGFRLREVASDTYDRALAEAGLTRSDIRYVIATGIGRHQVDFKDTQVTDLTASSRGALHLFPRTRTILDIGGQTMKATRINELGQVVSFRLNDKCAAGTGAFLEKTARYMGYAVAEIGPLMATSKEPVPISGVCAVFAESEVINHLSLGTPPADIMQGAVESLTSRSIQLIKRAGPEPEYTLIGGIMRFETMARSIARSLKADVNVPPPDVVQFVAALGCGILGHRRLAKTAAAAGAVLA
ncbi:MAG: 2-hydroxyglutaryl-CoA dehydratase [Gemmatimonadetes bacterium]|nr:2-hydroxyglutaryl-CoA dehydratase [Gemmatimonadota bacterium]